MTDAPTEVAPKPTMVAKVRRTPVPLSEPAGEPYVGSPSASDERDAAATAEDAFSYDVPATDPFSMADSNGGPSIVATPYPTYISPGGDDDGDARADVYAAALITQGDASTQRNQDSQFSALRSEFVHRDVQSGKRETVQAKYDLAVQGKDAEVRNADRFGEVKAELAALREKMDGQTIAQLRVDLAKGEADARQAKTESLLAAILAKLPV